MTVPGWYLPRTDASALWHLASKSLSVWSSEALYICLATEFSGPKEASFLISIGRRIPTKGPSPVLYSWRRQGAWRHGNGRSDIFVPATEARLPVFNGEAAEHLCSWTEATTAFSWTCYGVGKGHLMLRQRLNHLQLGQAD